MARLPCAKCQAPVAGEAGVLEFGPGNTHEPFEWYHDGNMYTCESCGFENVADIVESGVAEFSLTEDDAEVASYDEWQERQRSNALVYNEASGLWDIAEEGDS